MLGIRNDLPAPRMDHLVMTLLLWLATNSSYQVAEHAPPAVKLLTPAALTALVRERSGIAAEPGEPEVDARLNGMFVPIDGPRGTIYLVRAEDTPRAAEHPVPSDNPVFRERLLHELVHYAQHASGEAANYRCPSQGELAAYRLGSFYLRQLGIADPMRNRRAVAFMQTLC
jgi:hypothetical protein